MSQFNLKSKVLFGHINNGNLCLINHRRKGFGTETLTSPTLDEKKNYSHLEKLNEKSKVMRKSTYLTTNMNINRF